MHARCLEACPSTYVHNSPVELKVRAEMTCRGCGGPKEHSGLIVCWRCFSHRTDGKNFKYFNSLVIDDRWESFVEHLNRWLKHVGMGHNAIEG